MNILCNEGGLFCVRNVNERDLGLPRGRHCYEGGSTKMGERWQLWTIINI